MIKKYFINIVLPNFSFFQLESQREYFESKLTRVQEEATKQIQELSDRKIHVLSSVIF